MGTCPKCDEPVASVWIEDCDIRSAGGTWRGIRYLCPSCRCVLSVSIDPVALKTEIVDEILAELRKG